jgi:hypothetical protein
MTESKYCFGFCLERLRKSSDRVAGVPAEVRTEHIPNTSLQCNRYTNPVGGG